MKSNYLFGPFIGETIYELNYFVGHAIYLRKQNPHNRIIVLTREKNFDLYGKYATTLHNLPLSEDLEEYKFSCNNMRVNLLKDIFGKFKNRYKGMRIHGHFYPEVAPRLSNIKWFYPREEIDFDFKPRSENIRIAKEISSNFGKVIISSFHDSMENYNNYYIIPASYVLKSLNFNNIKDATRLGVLIELMRISEYIFSDIDDIVGRLAMLITKPLITKRDVLDVQYLSPINPYGSVVIGCNTLEEGIKHLEDRYENNF
jgi:hypothetical protein